MLSRSAPHERKDPVSKNATRDVPLYDDDAPGESDEEPFAVPDLIRRFAALGLSGFFTTESALRRAFGDTVPQDWLDFAAEQGERTRTELLDRVAKELSKKLEEVDLREVIEEMLDGHTIEIEAKIRVRANHDGSHFEASAVPSRKRSKQAPGE
jgi:hypothetical protein